jgi:hypothetical protein
MLSSAGARIFVASVSGLKARWTPGYVPHIVRAVGVHVFVSGAMTVRPEVSFLTNATPGATATTALTNITTATLATLLQRGKVFYVDNLNTQVDPGSEVQVRITNAATIAAKLAFSIYVEPKWEVPANNSNMIDGD